MIYSRFVLPLSKPALATVGLLTLLDYWNSWQPAMLYIDKKKCTVAVYAPGYAAKYY